MTWREAGSIALPAVPARPAEPDPQVQDVIRNALVSVPPQPWQSYMQRASYAAAGALTDLGLVEPMKPIRHGVRGWWDRLHCNHVWRAHGFADWRCPRCGKFR